MLPHYAPLETIAQALYGHVQKYQHTVTGEIVAVKHMDLSFASRKRAKHTDRVVEEDALTEIKINMKIKALGGHPFVLPMRDCFFDDNAVLLVMKYCAQGELLDVLNSQLTRLTTATLMGYFRQIVLGTNFLHLNGIAHRDLSLENVLVDEQNRCQITDFGLASTEQLLAPKPIGKVHYMAPEACGIHGDKPYDLIKADVWSLGIILFAMLAGQYPFREPLRRDDHFRLLEDFGVSVLMEKHGVTLANEPHAHDLVDLLTQLLTIDAQRRPTLASLLSHPVWSIIHESNPAIDATPSTDTAALSVEQSIPEIKTRSSCTFVAPTTSGNSFCSSNNSLPKRGSHKTDKELALRAAIVPQAKTPGCPGIVSKFVLSIFRKKKVSM